ncbi:hypothetical protein BC628DRAFT_1497708 [Trametes gibbosa]|nr:hypothetical protein BC628DRAFT_1497708 [Trametes gibbosa]
MTWNPKKRRSPAQHQHVQSNLRKIHPLQDDKENMSPAADLDSSAAASSSASDALASHAVRHEAQLLSQSGASTLDQGTIRRDLHNTRWREHWLQDAKEALQHQPKEVRLERLWKLTETEAQMKQAEGRVLDAETRAEMVEIQLEDTVGRMRMEMQIRDTQIEAANVRARSTEARAEEAIHCMQDVQAELVEYGSRLEAHAQSTIANILWLAQRAAEDLKGRMTHQMVQAEHRAQEAEAGANAAIKNEQARSAAEVLHAQRWAEQMAAEQEELTGRFWEELDNATRITDHLRKQSAELRKRNKILYMQAQCAPAQKACAVENALSAGASTTSQASPSLVLKEKGVIPDSTRALVQDMISLGLKIDQVKSTIETVARAVGTSVEGSLSNRSIRCINVEGLVALHVQIARKAHDADDELGITLSCDGTTIRNINFNS